MRVFEAEVFDGSSSYGLEVAVWLKASPWPGVFGFIHRTPLVLSNPFSVVTDSMLVA